MDTEKSWQSIFQLLTKCVSPTDIGSERVIIHKTLSQNTYQMILLKFYGEKSAEGLIQR